MTPQWELAEAFNVDSPDLPMFGPPTASDPANAAAYKEQVDAVLEASADLDDQAKGKAIFFDDKVRPVPPVLPSRLQTVQHACICVLGK